MRLEDGACEQSLMVQSVLECVDRTGEQYTAFVSCRERPMHEDDQQLQTRRVVDPILDERVWAIVDDGCNSCCHGELWRRNAENKTHHKGLRAVWLHRKVTTFNGSGNEHNKWRTEVANGCEIWRHLVSSFHSRFACTHEMPEKSHPLLLSQACPAKLGTVKRVLDLMVPSHWTIYGGRKPEVVRQAGTGLFMSRIGHVILQDFPPTQPQLLDEDNFSTPGMWQLMFKSVTMHFLSKEQW